MHKRIYHYFFFYFLGDLRNYQKKYVKGEQEFPGLCTRQHQPTTHINSPETKWIFKQKQTTTHGRGNHILFTCTKYGWFKTIFLTHTHTPFS